MTQMSANSIFKYSSFFRKSSYKLTVAKRKLNCPVLQTFSKQMCINERAINMFCVNDFTVILVLNWFRKNKKGNVKKIVSIKFRSCHKKEIKDSTR